MNTLRPRIRSLLATLCVVASGYVGCADNAPLNAPSAACFSDSECESSLTCREQRCTVSEPDDRDLSFMFIPPASSAFLPQRTQFFEISPSYSLDFALEPSVSVLGQIGSFNVSGTLVFTPSGSVDPLLRRQAPVDRGDYQVSLVPGSYTIDFISSTEGVPNRAWRNIRFETDVQHDLPLPDLSQAISITGNVNFKDPTVGIGSGLGLARVTAVSRTTGVLSTSVVTDANSGFYEGLRLWRGTGSYDVVVSSANGDPLIPTVTFREAIDTDTIPANASTFETNLFVGDFSVAERVVRLELDEAVEQSLLGLSPSDLDVQLTASLDTGDPNVDAVFNLRGSVSASDDESSTPLSALPLRYIGEIVPPAGSRYARTPIEVDLSSIGARVVKLPAPTELDLSSTLIRTFTGAPAEGARVTFTPRTRNTGSSTQKSTENSRAFEVYANADGEIGVWLEPDVDYDMRVDPMTTDSPRATVTITGDALPPVFELPSPSLISGSVWSNDSSGASIADVTVRVIERNDGVEQVITEGQTDANGAFRLIAPDDAD